MKNEVNINPDMLTWAVNRAGYEVDEFISTFPKLDAWLRETKKPTFKQLQEFARKVYVPFGYLFLQDPPKETLPIPFFRTLSGETDEVNINIFDTILLLKQRQEWLSEYLVENDFEPLPFVGKYDISTPYQVIVDDIRAALGLTEKWASQFSTWEDTLEFLTSKIEDIGIVVSFNGVVENNTHRPIKVEDCRGFVLVDDHAPFMYINTADAKAAQMFTILHELTHIWIGASAGFDLQNMQPSDDPVEILCDQVAAEFLVPAKQFHEIWEKEKSFKNISRQFKVSPIVVARRALDLNKISKQEFFSFYNKYVSEFKLKKESRSSGGDFYRTTKKRVSLKFAAHINQAVKSGELLYKDAYKLTGLKGNTYQKFVNEYFS